MAATSVTSRILVAAAKAPAATVLVRLTTEPSGLVVGVPRMVGTTLKSVRDSMVSTHRRDPRPLRAALRRVLPANAKRARVYDPWTGKWSNAAVRAGVVALPEFARSIVVRVRS